MEAEVFNYSDVREAIGNGDVLLYRGRGMFSRFIRKVIRSPYSHAGIATWWNSRLVVMEAVGSGVVVTPLSANVAHYDGGVEWYRCTRSIDERTRGVMVRFAQEQLGKKYSIPKMVVVFLHLLFNWKMDVRDKLKRTGSLFCSYYVAQVYNAGGLDLKKQCDDRFMSPRDIAASPLMRQVATLKSEDGKVSWRRFLGKPKVPENAAGSPRQGGGMR